MLAINLVFIPAVFFIGIVTSYQDIKFGKIRHKWIGMGLIYSLSGYLLLYLLSVLKIVDYRSINYSYLQELFINGFISIITAYVLWKLGIWAAGDAKLFIVYALLIPLDYYSRSYFPHFPSFALLLNIFLPIFLFILLMAFMQALKLGVERLINYSRRKNSPPPAKEWYGKLILKIKGNWQKIVGGLVSYALMFLGLQILMSRLRLNPIWVIISIIAISRVITKGVKNNRKVLLSAGIVLLAWLGYQILYRHDLLSIALIFKNVIRLMLVFGIANGILNLYIKYTQVRTIGIDELKPMMLLSDEGIKGFQRELKDYKGALGTIYPDGLSEGQTELIKKIYLEKGYKTIEVYRTFPFAIWIFLGALLTLALRQNVLSIFR